MTTLLLVLGGAAIVGLAGSLWSAWRESRPRDPYKTLGTVHGHQQVRTPNREGDE